MCPNGRDVMISSFLSSRGGMFVIGLQRGMGVWLNFASSPNDFSCNLISRMTTTYLIMRRDAVTNKFRQWQHSLHLKAAISFANNTLVVLHIQGCRSNIPSYRNISQRLEYARLNVEMLMLLWNLTAGSAAVLPRRLSNFKAIAKLWAPISRIRSLARFYPMTSSAILHLPRFAQPTPAAGKCRE